jgi:hypothetical protein
MITTCMNLDSGGTSRFENFYFNSMTHIDGKPYGMDSDGMFLLEGANDDTENIECSVSPGRLGMESNVLKRLCAVYVAAKSENPVAVVVRTSDDVFVYEARSSSDRMTMQRVDTGRGLRETWYDIDVCNTGGSPIEIRACAAAIVESERKI